MEGDFKQQTDEKTREWLGKGKPKTETESILIASP